MAKDRTQYRFEGQTLDKGGLVLNVIKYHQKQSGLTCHGLSDAFISVPCRENQLIVEKTRYDEEFNKSSDIETKYFIYSPLIDIAGTIFYVSNQWNRENIDKFVVCARSLGLIIDIVADQSSELIRYFNYFKSSFSHESFNLYQERCEFISGIDINNFDFSDKSFLETYWRSPNNGVSSVKPGMLSTEEFEALKPELPQISRNIIMEPSLKTHAQVLIWAQQCKREGKFKSIKYGVINRFFCACSPAHLSTILSYEHLKRFVLNWNKTKFGAAVDLSDNWYDLNTQSLNTIKMCGLEKENIYLVSAFVYQLKQFLAGENDDAFGEEFKPKRDSKVVDILPRTKRVESSLNQILYGPPGTGKTHRTVEQAVQIIDPQWFENLKAQNFSVEIFRRKLKIRFDQLIKSKHIAFTTFHQSFSYEDFVEGLKAESDGGQISYNVEDGIFKEICIQIGSVRPSGNLEAAITDIKEKCSDEPLQLFTVTGKPFLVTYRGNKTFRCLPEASVGQRDLPANVDHVRKVCLGEIPENLYCGSYVRAIAKYIIDNYGIDTTNSKQEIIKNTPHVLIIDEINRGNISKIFGELITLMEPGKRKGEPEALTVTLPYSKEIFSVPSSLFVIGTMNTADSSLAKVDIALRRRFEFVEMMPNPKLLHGCVVEGVDIERLLETVNQRIELLYDRDHTIGHSYFMGLSSDSQIDDLAAIFEKQIIPLLEEYFFDDWALIHRVLGDHLKDENQQKFIIKRYSNSDISRLMGVDWKNDNNIQPLWKLNRVALTNPEAYRGIYTDSESTLTKLDDRVIHEDVY